MAKFVCEHIHGRYEDCEGYECGEATTYYNCNCKHLNLAYCTSESMIDKFLLTCSTGKDNKDESKIV
jgi:hypothetical protein